MCCTLPSGILFLLGGVGLVGRLFGVDYGFINYIIIIINLSPFLISAIAIIIIELKKHNRMK